jgi:hypothetical protein
MHITTTVNFGVKPAVCITIVAARETDERFGGGYPEAACFLTYRAYMDDATAETDTMAKMRRLLS